MHNDQLVMLKELMEVGFCTIEMSLFLDTHPTDERAVGLHNSYAIRYKELTDAYNMKYGPLTSNDLSKCPWEFIAGPWPWEIDYINCCI
ncbi:MAG: spore coat protein CotJB [Firmicutes bacterium HGW-Firmicutes-1]|jgi:spore coat protein JB|nr:MAG: spore coat protein CotJB [Firmicutes bacterium HGW-Firmicutes-1]